MSSPFVKVNRTALPDHLRCEAAGLEELRSAAAGTSIDVPAVSQVDERQLALPPIRAASFTAAHWQRLGRGLAAIHDRPQPRFGFHADNYIGGNPPPNAWMPNVLPRACCAACRVCGAGRYASTRMHR